MTTNYDKYPHYFKPVPAGVTHIDVYAVLQLFGVTDQAIGHAIKKLLVPGVRGTKSKSQDVQEAIDTLERWKAMNKEFQPKAALSTIKLELDENGEQLPKPKKPATTPGHGSNSSYYSCDD